jgi:hypothetical protein
VHKSHANAQGSRCVVKTHIATVLLLFAFCLQDSPLLNSRWDNFYERVCFLRKRVGPRGNRVGSKNGLYKLLQNPTETVQSEYHVDDTLFEGKKKTRASTFFQPTST